MCCFDFALLDREIDELERQKHTYVAITKLHKHIYKSLVVTSLLVAWWAMALVGGLFLGACLFSLQNS